MAISVPGCSLIRTYLKSKNSSTSTYTKIVKYLFVFNCSWTTRFILLITLSLCRLLLDGAETKTASKISLSKGSYNSTHDEFLNRFPIHSIEEIRDLDEVHMWYFVEIIQCLCFFASYDIIPLYMIVIWITLYILHFTVWVCCIACIHSMLGNRKLMVLHEL